MRFSRPCSRRQAASAKLKRWQPVTWPAMIHAAERSPSLETRHRCETILAGALVPRTEADFDGVFERIVADDWERNGIPWNRDWVRAWFAASRRAQSEFVRWAGDDLSPWDRQRIQCEGVWFHGTETVAMNDRRFARVGLPPTRDPMPWCEVRILWSRMKAGCR